MTSLNAPESNPAPQNRAAPQNGAAPRDGDAGGGLAEQSCPRLGRETAAGIGIVGVFLAGFVGWAALAPLESAAIAPGVELLLDDGRIRLRIVKSSKDHAESEIIAGGALSDHKGVNLPNVALPIAALTEKDRRDLQFGLDLGVDWIALSFVQRPEDIAEARKLMMGRASIMSKLEKPSAIDRLDEIIEISDGIMVARGDLGVELAPEKVPGLQKEIIARARSAGRSNCGNWRMASR